LRTIPLSIGSGSDGVVLIRLKDQGGGIAAADIPQVVKFFRTSARLNTMSLYQGSRLELFLQKYG
jgi:hypothetical protein